MWLTKDKVPVLAHDLLRGLVFSAADLHKYVLTNGETIPTLAKVLDICEGRVYFNIEIKDIQEEHRQNYRGRSAERHVRTGQTQLIQSLPQKDADQSCQRKRDHSVRELWIFSAIPVSNLPKI